jgi:signal transduction histidine kinase
VAASLAHNVNNALTGVIGYLELALREAAAGTPLREHVSGGLRCAVLLAERVRRLVAFAARPGPDSRGAPASLGQAAEEAARRAALSRPGLRVVLAVPAADCPVPASLPLLHLVLEQLVSNALEAMPAGGVLSLRVWDEGPRRCLSVADTGHGLGAEARRRLFEPFFTTKSFGHLGLGLTLCRDMIEAQGGALHVSSAEGQGTTVTLAFPPAEEPAPAQAAPHAAPGGSPVARAAAAPAR